MHIILSYIFIVIFFNILNLPFWVIKDVFKRERWLGRWAEAVAGFEAMDGYKWIGWMGHK
jgi:hypothetical protein